MKNKFVSSILLFLFTSIALFAQNLNGSWYEDTLHERSRFRDYFYRINDTQLSVVDKKNNKSETFFDYTIANGYITIKSTGKNSPKISAGKYPITIKDENYFTINFSSPMSFVRNSYAIAQAEDVRNKALIVAGTGAVVATVGVVGEKAIVASGVLAGTTSKVNASTGSSGNIQNTKQVKSSNLTNFSSLSRCVGDNKQNYVYRVIRSDENPKLGLKAKNPERNMSVEGHIVSGSRNYGSQYISTTTDYNIAKDWAAKDNCRIVKIDLNKIPENVNIYDLSTDEGRNIFLKGISAKNFAKASKEVLLEGEIPSLAIEVVK